jgi:hypothetical protein
VTSCKRCGKRLDAPEHQPHTHVVLDTVGKNHEPLGRWSTLLCIACTKLLHDWLEPS